MSSELARVLVFSPPVSTPSLSFLCLQSSFALPSSRALTTSRGSQEQQQHTTATINNMQHDREELHQLLQEILINFSLQWFAIGCQHCSGATYSPLRGEHSKLSSTRSHELSLASSIVSVSLCLLRSHELARALFSLHFVHRSRSLARSCSLLTVSPQVTELHVAPR